VNIIITPLASAILAIRIKAKNSISIAPIASLDTEALGGVQTRAFWKDVSLDGA